MNFLFYYLLIQLVAAGRKCGNHEWLSGVTHKNKRDDLTCTIQNARTYSICSMLVAQLAELKDRYQKLLTNDEYELYMDSYTRRLVLRKRLKMLNSLLGYNIFSYHKCIFERSSVFSRPRNIEFFDLITTWTVRFHMICLQMITRII